MKVLNYLGRYKRRDLINAFFDSNGTNSGLYAVVGKLYDIQDNKQLNRIISGRTTKDISQIIIDQLEREKKDAEKLSSNEGE